MKFERHNFNAWTLTKNLFWALAGALAFVTWAIVGGMFAASLIWALAGCSTTPPRTAPRDLADSIAQKHLQPIPTIGPPAPPGVLVISAGAQERAALTVNIAAIPAPALIVTQSLVFQAFYPYMTGAVAHVQGTHDLITWTNLIAFPADSQSWTGNVWSTNPKSFFRVASPTL